MVGVLSLRAPADMEGEGMGVQGSDVCPSLSLSANGISPAGGVRLAESLALCKQLEELM